jgi:hypothetical protein
MKKLLLVPFLLAAAPLIAETHLAVKPTYEVGAGAYLYDPYEPTVDESVIRVWAALGGIVLPLPGEELPHHPVSGVMVEAGSFGGVGHGALAGGVGYGKKTALALVWSIWQTNCTEVSRIIGCVDLRVANGGPVEGSDFDFAARGRAGYRFTKNVALYAKFFEPQLVIGFDLGWKF